MSELRGGSSVGGFPILHLGNIANAKAGYAGTADNVWNAGQSSLQAAYLCNAANGNGIGFWNSPPTTSYGIYMGDTATYGSVAADGTNDYHIYYKMTASSRGHIFITGDGVKKLQITNSGTYNSTWYRSTTTSTGWYHEVHGGGIYMDDATYVKIYGGKQFLVANNCTATEFIRTSSRLGKTNIKDFNESSLDILLNTSIKTYTKTNNNEFGIGFIAEDTHEYLSGEKHDSHNFGAHLSLLTKGLQEEDDKVTKLEKRVKELEDIIKKIK